jgi:chromosome segregation ATPase
MLPPFLDFSSAVPWVGAGFLLGLIVSWLFRKISGVDARRLKEIEGLHATLDDARRAHANLSAANGQLESERARLTAEINQISPRASLVPQLERQTAELKQALTSAQNAADIAGKDLAATREKIAAEIAELRQDAEVKGSTAKYYEEEYGRLHAAHQALNKDWTNASGLVSKLQSDYAVAARSAEEATRLRSDAAALRAQIDSLRADVEAAKASGKGEADKAIAQANASVAELQAALVARDGDIARLKGEVQSLGPAQAVRTQLEQEVGQLKAQLASAPKQDLSGEVSRLGLQIQSLQNDLRTSESAKAAEVSRLNLQIRGLQSDLRASETSRASLLEEANRLKSAAPTQDFGAEVQRLTAALNQALAQERAAAMELHSTKTDLGQARTALEETTRLLGERHSEVEDLRAKLATVPDVETYRRFKDALEAANRIASGQSDKG